MRLDSLGAVLALATLGFVAGCDGVNGPRNDAVAIDDYDATDNEAEAAAQGARFSWSERQRVDRMGMPAVATAVITSKDAYNAANPVDDAAGAFVDEIVTNVGVVHSALDDDLAALGLTPCATAVCVGQAAPFVVPDVIRIDPAQPSGFPNGRRLTDPVIDVTLALVLLDLAVHPVSALIGVNPTENDLDFAARFPYLAGEHRP